MPRPESLFGDISESMPWHKRLTARFQRTHEINVAEKKARVLLVKDLARDPASWNTRYLGVHDSAVTLGGAARGRSSAAALNRLAQQEMAFVLGAGLTVGGGWCESYRHGSDAASRDGGVPVPTPARPWVSELRHAAAQEEWPRVREILEARHDWERRQLCARGYAHRWRPV